MSVSVPLLRTHQIIPFIALTAYTGEEGHSQPRETRLGTLDRLLQILNMSTFPAETFKALLSLAICYFR